MTPIPPGWLLACVPVLIGTVVMLAGGAPIARWGTHLAALPVGLVVYALAARAPLVAARGRLVLALGAVLSVGLTLAAPGLDGVQRWLVLGPLRVQPSALVVPALLVLAAGFPHATLVLPAALLAVQIVHVLQPDAGQATAVAAASVVLLAGPVGGGSRACLVASIAVAVVAWLRPDPLQPAPFVEDVVALAFDLTPWLGCAALVAVVAGVLAPWAERRRADLRVAAPATARSAAAALEAYLVTTFLVSLTGRFPVPLLGAAVSPVVGWFLGLGVLRGLFGRAPLRPS
jgi:cell division protein FtsW (lipid II flippase)